MSEPETRPIPPLPAHRYYKTQELADALVAEALDDFPPLPNSTMRANTVRLLAGMYYVHGSMAFPRGWVTPAMQAFIERGIDCPNARCWRSYRSDLKDNPGQFLNNPGVPTDLLRQMELDLMGAT
ncbi:hypothetical protein PVW46_14295 [Mameliella sp. AT18]|uniref:hypothetical protein n=1 Tax=Mameliella sp. AT18 TaxID=3028385 RepID=UPI001112F0B9|nr:hypothetical protein [Mameliella sp. AT18]MDD9731083.1 hypothetical protein [Mameliella sp. AT18]